MSDSPPTRSMRAKVTLWWQTQHRSILPLLFSDRATIDLRFVGRILFHAALVGIAAGLLGAAFFRAIEYVQQHLLVDLAGYVPLRAHGEIGVESGTVVRFRPWVLVLLPAVGGLLCGLLTRLAPEVRGGGSDAMIEAFHHRAGIIRRRVIWVKWLASLCTLGTGGAGGREGPTMLIGGALGSAIGRLLRVSTRERRILLVAGVAAGISAVFRTPLGAALLAVEVLYRDGFESDALIPSVLSSVVAYSIVITLFGESTLFSHASHFPFVPGHLWLFALLALCIAVLALLFLRVFHIVRGNTRSPAGALVDAAGDWRAFTGRVRRANYRIRRNPDRAAWTGSRNPGGRLRSGANGDFGGELATPGLERGRAVTPVVASQAWMFHAHHRIGG